MAYAPKPSFTKEDSQPIVIQNKMPKQGETDVTGNLPGGAGNTTFRLVGNTGTQAAQTTGTSSNPYPVGYTSGMPNGLDTVSGPGASYQAQSGGGTTPGGGGTTPGTGGYTGDKNGGSGFYYNPNPPGTSPPRGTFGGNYTPPVNNPGTYNPNDIGRGIGWGQPGGWDPNTPSPGTTGGASDLPPGWTFDPRGGGGGGGGTTPPPPREPVTTGGQQSQSYARVGTGGMPVQYGAMDSSTNGGGKPPGSGDGSPYLGPPGGTGQPPQTGPGNNPWQINRDRIMGWHAGPGAWSHNPGRGPLAPTWMGGQYNPWTGQGGGTAPPWVPGGGGGGSTPPPPGGKDPVMAGGPNPGLMSSQTTGQEDPGTQQTGWSGFGLSGGTRPVRPSYLGSPGQQTLQQIGAYQPQEWPAGWNGSTVPTTPPGPDYEPPGKGGMNARTGVQRPNDQGAQRGWRYDQAGQPIYNDQLPPVGGANMSAREPGYLGPPVQGGNNFPPFPPFDPQNPPTPQQWLEIVRQWMSQFSGDGRPNQWQGQRPSNPIQNPTWGAPWPGWNTGQHPAAPPADPLRNTPPSRPPGGTRYVVSQEEDLRNYPPSRPPGGTR